MSKRKHRNKFRFHPHAVPAPVGPAVTDEQTQLPLPPAAEARPEAENSNSCAEEATVQAPVEPVPAVFDEPAPRAEMRLVHAPAALDASLGQRLRAAREARGMSCESASHMLKLPATVIKALEAEQFERIGHGVFLRGYLSKYLQLLDLPQVLAERVVQEHAEPPPLTTNGTISHPRYLFERYSGSALYVILTGVIVVPAVLLALRAGFDQNLAHVTPLDAPPAVIAAPVAQHPSEAPVTAADVSQFATKPMPVPATAKPEETPLVASMTPFPAATESKPAAVAAAIPGSANRLHLSLSQASWVEVVDVDGKKLEYGLLPAGSERDYASDRALEIRIGNVDGAVLTIDGKPQDMASFRHANVARFKVADGAAVAINHSSG